MNSPGRPGVSGPLKGFRVLELGGMGPAPYAGMLCADYGADVIRVDRPARYAGIGITAEFDLLNRGKRSIVLDLKHSSAAELVAEMVRRCDVVLEGFRPGVLERLGMGPDQLLSANPALVIGRMTGWGQTGPYASMAGHDLGYIAVSGVLHGIGQADGPPQIPMNIVGDFAGGGTFLALGVLAALLERGSTGRGQIIDASILDGTLHLLSGIYSELNADNWVDARGSNALDGGAPFYAIYQTLDNRYLTVAAIESKFFEIFLCVADVDYDAGAQHDRSRWSELRDKIAGRISTRTLDDWVQLFTGTDGCVAPVVSLRESASHPQVKSRGSVQATAGRIEPTPTPRFSNHPIPPAGRPASTPGLDSREILRNLQIANIEDLFAAQLVEESS
jgi:alpha-methylacyl-CoA racemase